ncbi:MAG TPA: PQQ-dependent sugar dehydrogenase [Actinopolymorphaceae bacterium]
MRLLPVLCVVAVLSGPAVLSGCGGDPATEPSPPDRQSAPDRTSTPTATKEPSPTGSPTTREPAVSTVSVAGAVAQELTSPWGLVFLPNGDALLSERDTALVKRITPSGRVSRVGRIPGVISPDRTSEGGLLGLAYRDKTLYAYFTSEHDDNRIVKMAYDPARPGAGLGEPEVILDGIPSASFHNGGRIVFGPDGHLYVGTGDGADTSNSQDMDSLGGKILRITTDGDPAPDNPFGDSPVWSLGHRNPQGLAFDPDGRLWASEFGQDTWDELNLIRPGNNYGWPEVEGEGGGDEFVDPLAVWGTDEASPSGLAYAGGALWMAGLGGDRLWRIDVDGDRVVGEPKAYFTREYGRLRTIEPAPDGSLWLTTSNTDGRGEEYRRSDDDRILRLTLSPA